MMKGLGYAIIVLAVVIEVGLLFFGDFSPMGNFVLSPPSDTNPTKDCCQLSSWECLLTSGCTWAINGCVQTGQLYDSCKKSIWLEGQTDIECGGGNRPPCDNGDNCAINRDCQSDFCNNYPSVYYNNGAVSFKCTACTILSASDNLQNCGETGIDCGGGMARYPCSCYNARVDEGSDATDCNLPESLIKVCEACTLKESTWLPAHCSDKRIDNGEICTDCGGSCIFARNDLPGCCVNSVECKNAGYGWCAATQRCKIMPLEPSCYIDKAGCEAAGFGWCASTQRCVDSLSTACVAA